MDLTQPIEIVVTEEHPPIIDVFYDYDSGDEDTDSDDGDTLPMPEINDFQYENDEELEKILLVLTNPSLTIK